MIEMLMLLFIAALCRGVRRHHQDARRHVPFLRHDVLRRRHVAVHRRISRRVSRAAVHPRVLLASDDEVRGHRHQPLLETGLVHDHLPLP